MKSLSLIFLLIGSFSFAQTTVLFDSFETGIPLYYTMINNDGFTPNAAVSEYTEAWISATDPDDASNKVASSTSYFDPVGRADRWLVSPQITLGAFGNILSWNAKSHDGSYPEDYYILLSTTTNDFASFTDTLGLVIDESQYWTNYEINLSEKGYDNETVYIAFGLRTYDGFKMYLDSVYLRKDDPAGITSLNNELSFNVYPNPTNDIINIDFDGYLDRIRVLSVTGKEIHAGKDKSINLSSIESGIYFVELSSGNSKAVKRIIKN